MARFYHKDSQLLSFNEDMLRKLIADNVPEKQLLKMANKVRAARIRTIKARKVSGSYGGRDIKAGLAKLDQKISELRSTTPEAILNEFRNRKS